MLMFLNMDLKKSVIFEIVDLSKFQITIVDTDRKFVKSKQTGKKNLDFWRVYYSWL